MASFLHSQQTCVPKPNEDENDKEKAKEEDCCQQTNQKYNDIFSTLPKERRWRTEHLMQYQDTWLPSGVTTIKIVTSFQQHFKALPTGIILATYPKSGTTWFKARIFAIMNRTRFEISLHPLLTTNPQDCIPTIEELIYVNHLFSTQNVLPSPRLFSTHFPYALFPQSMMSSGCRTVYVSRNPKDVLVSMWHFFGKMRPKELPPLSLGEAFELFCEGISLYGPFWDHVLGFWNASLHSPEKVLFMSYENMKREPLAIVKKLAQFLGQPFSLEEVSRGVVEEIIRLCSFENLSNLEVNKSGVKKYNKESGAIENRHFFRKGQIGDWKNHLTTEMWEHLDQIIEKKFDGSGLTFDVPA